jgi:hypothetical protein
MSRSRLGGGAADVMRQGFRMIFYSGDLWVFRSAVRNALGALRAAALG